MKTEATISDRILHYHATARRWVSDIEFFKIETAFLHKLMDDYFIRLADAEHIEKLRGAGKKLLQLEDDKN